MTEQPIIEQKPIEPVTKKSKFRYVLFLIIFILLVAAIICGIYQFKTSTQLEQQNKEISNKIVVLQKSLEELQPLSQKYKTVSEEQQQLVADIHQIKEGDINKWKIAEAQYLVRLASDQLEYAHNTQSTLVLLQRAQKTLQNIQDPRLNDILQSLSKDISETEATSQFDVNALYTQLTELDTKIDALPLANNPIKKEAVISSSKTDTNRPWWQAVLDSSVEALHKIVIVRYNGSNALPLVMPEEKMFLYQNLHAQIENATWGLLHNNQMIYQTSLARATTWIKKYFIEDANETKDVLALIASLQKITVPSSSVHFANTLQLLDQYLAQAAENQA